MSVSQPLLRDLSTDAPRAQLLVSHNNRDIVGTRLQDSLIHTAAATKTAYWNLVSARAVVDARRTSLQLSEELTRVNKAKVDVGQSPPLDMLSAQAEVAANQEQLIVAETAIRQAEDRLRVLIFDATKRDVWNIQLEPIDAPPTGTVALDVESAVTTALSERGDLRRSHKDVENAKINREAGREPTAARHPRECHLSGERPRRHRGRAYRRVSGHHRRTRDHHPVRNRGRSAVQPRLPDMGRGPERVVSDRAEHGRSELRAYAPSKRQAEQRVKSAETRAIQQGARRRVEGGDERQADRHDAVESSVRRAATRCRAEALRSRACRPASW